jgi:hypothetical protein
VHSPVGTALGAQAVEAKLRAVIADGGFRNVRSAIEAPFNMILSGAAVTGATGPASRPLQRHKQGRPAVHTKFSVDAALVGDGRADSYPHCVCDPLARWIPRQ